MNILLLTDELRTGGAEVYFCRLENNLGHSALDFYTAARKGVFYDQLIHKQRFLQMHQKKHVNNLMKIRKFIREYNIELIHANSLRMLGFAVVIQACTKKKLKIVYTKHNTSIVEKNFSTAYVKLLNRFVTRIITISEWEQQNLIEKGVNPALIQNIYNGVDLTRFQFKQKPDSKKWKVGILARLSPEKNHSLFLEIAHQLKSDPDMEFYIGGEGPERKKIERQIREMHLEEKVKMLGAIQNPEAFIKEMNVLLLTSKHEMFPMVILEAMAVGTPIVSADVGGIKEAVVSSETGFLVADYSAEMFCRNIQLLKNDLKIRNLIVQNARMRVEERFSLDQMVDSTIRQYLQQSTFLKKE